jgi:SulP family sulfate permease
MERIGGQKVVLKNTLAGAIGSLMVLTYCAVNANLLCQKELVSFLPVGILITLLAAVLSNFLVPLQSNLRPLICAPTIGLTSLLSMMVQQVERSMQIHGTAFYMQNDTIFASLVFTCVGAGFVMFFVGYFKIANLIRFIPQAVMQGFLLIVAWLVFSSGYHLIVGDESWSLSLLPNVIASVCVAVVIFLLTAYRKHFSNIPGVVFFSSAIFYGAIFFTGTSFEQLIKHHWLQRSATYFTLYTDFPMMSMHIDWLAVFSASQYILSTWVFILITLLLYCTSLELVFDQKANLNQELKLEGLTNILCGCMGMNSIISLMPTYLAQSIAPQQKYPGLITAIICLLVLLVCPSSLAFLPRCVVAGVLFYFAFEMALERLKKQSKHLLFSDYCIGIFILLCAIIWGFLPGIGIGLLICAGLFIIRYSKTAIVLCNISLADHQSNVMRPPEDSHYLHQHGKFARFVKLQGYLFFGSSHLLVYQLSQMMDTTKYLILDFSRVTGMDGSALMSFEKLSKIASAHKLVLVFSAWPKNTKYLWDKSALAKSSNIMMTSDLDHGIEWIEDQFLMQKSDQLNAGNYPCVPSFYEFSKYIETVSLSQGTLLFKKEEPATDMYILDKGMVTTYILNPQGEPKRLRKLLPGSMVGEIGFFLNTPRTANVVLEEDAVLLKITREAYNRMKKEAPMLVIALQEYIIYLTCERLKHSTKEIERLLD